ncbi:uncharacterized protein LOC129567353 isoform X2 [Sitodiplosis mosellana]|uniref:uncharacterized protein LOC129567353 isoform X2 n=1 Tax=Sitodiplosis mosellana TaxID=263140 RepID=UPI002444BFD3|nr:uncharacterized protein LOC129567353 isoform X2 [Sitodiplosis mosellana]
MASSVEPEPLPEPVAEQTMETLSEDCVFEIFDRLPTKYLYQIAETCTRFFDLASIQYRRQHPEKFVCLTVIDDKIVLLPNEYDVKLFGRKFLNIMIRGDGRNCRWEDALLQFILANCSASLQMIRFEKAMLKSVQLKAMHHMFHRLETVVLHECGMTDDFYDSLLSACHRLKHIIISDSYTIIDPVGSKWMQMKYPLLETVQISSITMLPYQREVWVRFFRQNSQIKSFACDHWYSIDAMDRPIKIIASNVPNLNRLFISLRGIGHLNSTYYDLSVLCEAAQFQRLELQFNGNTGCHYLMRHAKLLAKIKPFHTLHLSDMALTKDISQVIISLVNLKRLNFVKITFSTEFAETVSSGLPNLEVIYSDEPNDFTPFIRNAPKLTKIELADTEFGALNLGWGMLWLNDERTKITGACPITIYVKSISMEDAEHSVISIGIIAIKPMPKDKHLLTKVGNSFVD